MCRFHCLEAESEQSEACFHQIKYELQENRSFLKICKQVVIPNQATEGKYSLRNFFHQISKQNKDANQLSVCLEMDEEESKNRQQIAQWCPKAGKKEQKRA